MHCNGNLKATKLVLDVNTVPTHNKSSQSISKVQMWIKKKERNTAAGKSENK
jgi:hypothetical protein